MSDIPPPFPLAMPMDATDPERDLRFVEAYVRRQDALVAVIEARIISLTHSAEVLARLMMARPDIQRLIAFLQAQKLHYTDGEPEPLAEVTRQSLIADAQRIYEMAMRDQDSRGAVAAKKFQSEVAGFATKQVELTTRTVVEMDTSALLRIARRAVREHGRVIDGVAEPLALTGVSDPRPAAAV